MTEPSRAVFLSYASEDAPAAQRIAEALRSTGIEVWFDQSELRGGDVWDRDIRDRIHECRLFIAVISANTDARDEGYFRREWKLAVDRTHDMAEDRAFLVPVAIDGTSERSARVPDSFKQVQWTRLPAGETTPAFIERIRRLVSPEETPERAVTRPPAVAESSARESVRAPRLSTAALLAIAALLCVGLVYLVVDKFWISKHPAASAPASSAASVAAPQTSTVPATFNPPPHSIAVLPFVNMSGDKEQEYFSDGLSEELLNNLARINELQVAARTSAFSFKGKDIDIETIARKLNVGAVLEGSVRRAGRKIRVTAQLNNGVNGFHLWSQTYDRDLRDALKLQTEIANAVATALKVTLLGDLGAKIEVGGTHNPAAFDAYLRGTKAATSGHETQAIAAYTEAIRLDPNYALAFAGRSYSYSHYAGAVATGTAIREYSDKGLADARRAIALAPDLGEGHMALALQTVDFRQGNESLERARALAPGSAKVLRMYGINAVTMGHFDAGLADLRRAVALDPLNPQERTVLGMGLYLARRYEEAIAALTEATSLDPDWRHAYGFRGLAYYALGDLASARTSCESKGDYWVIQWCLAVVYDKLGRHAEAEAAVAKLRASRGDAWAYEYATIYTQWGYANKALEWLETARLRDSSALGFLKTDPLLDPLRNEQRFQAIERALKFPD